MMSKRLKWKTLAIIAGLGIVFSIGMIKATSTPSFCSTCHEMKPEYATWTASSHNKVSCVKCHMEPGAANFLKAKLNGLRQVYLHLAGEIKRPIHLPDSISREVCESCHSLEREVTPSVEIKMPHGKHFQSDEIVCTDCHRLVAHAGVADQGAFQIDGKVLKALAATRPERYRAEMPKCVQCHAEQQIVYQCYGCHKDSRKPESHPEKIRGLEFYWR